MFYGLSSTDLVEKQNWVNLPVMLRYDHVWDKRIKPFAYVGAGVNYLLSSSSNVFLTDDSPFNITESPSLKFTARRNSLNFSAILGGGLKYKYGLNYVFGDVRYYMGLTNVFDYKAAYLDYSISEPNNNTSDELLDSGTASFRFASLDNFFRMNHLMVTIGYIHPLYKPRVVKRPRTRSVLKMIRKQSDE